ncbi:aspartate carbamoyltransferase catalytic subunit [Coprothermobacter platensis]|uniref:aspartate carbamoyltransferase catalytic subunit n=1 Tax=Coprothermobacter platensis TaxID=108819 RepID=UPI0003A9918D|nr:aspartate carbamoyltransferase catalytic subunit [Coprothermobacter platensis]
MKHLLGIEELSKEDILYILNLATPMKDIILREVKKVPTLRGKIIATLFYEPSTRTKNSFELAAKLMSADLVSVGVSTSSVQKGESLKDTIYTLEAMGVDAIVIRHSRNGVPNYLSSFSHASIINAGDGQHEHPSQALLDLFTIQEHKGHIEGLKVLIVGDIMHSRVAKSNIYALNKLGAKVVVSGPPTLIPNEVREYAEICYSLDEAIKDVDVVNVLRLQLERQQTGLINSLQEYHRFYGLTSERVKHAKNDLLVLHPGPMNRGVEIDEDVAYSEKSAINEQVSNGVAVRMAIYYMLMGGKEQ